MTFFDVPPPTPAPPKPPSVPPWFGPPERTLGGLVTQYLVIAKNDKAAVIITRLVGYPLGFSIDLTLVGRNNELELPPVMPYYRARPGESVENQFRIGLLFSDGTKVVADMLRIAPGLQDWHSLASLDRPTEPILRINGGGGGSGNSFQWSYWATPLPPAGPLRFVVQWLAVGITESFAEIDGQVIRDAGTSAVPIWDE